VFTLVMVCLEIKAVVKIRSTELRTRGAKYPLFVHIHVCRRFCMILDGNICRPLWVCKRKGVYAPHVFPNSKVYRLVKFLVQITLPTQGATGLKKNSKRHISCNEEVKVSD
jgi:hypothetical protein